MSRMTWPCSSSIKVYARRCRAPHPVELAWGRLLPPSGFPTSNTSKSKVSVPRVARGEISSLDGPGDDPRSWRVSVPVQSGNPGGPLLDKNGNIIGIIVATLGLKAAQETGDITQNVNYAMKSAYALVLLEPYLNSESLGPNDPEIKPTLEDLVGQDPTVGCVDLGILTVPSAGMGTAGR